MSLQRFSPRRCCLLISAVTLSACGELAEVAEPATDSGNFSPGGFVTAQRPANSRSYVDPGESGFARIAERVPGFAGYHFDASGNVIVKLADNRGRALANAVFRRLLDEQPVDPTSGWAPGRQVLIDSVEFSFWELAWWKALLIERVWPIPGVVSFDLEEEYNRLEIGVLADSLVEVGSRVQVIVGELGIPQHAVFVVEDGIAAPNVGIGAPLTAGDGHP